MSREFFSSIIKWILLQRLICKIALGELWCKSLLRVETLGATRKNWVLEGKDSKISWDDCGRSSATSRNFILSRNFLRFFRKVLSLIILLLASSTFLVFSHHNVFWNYFPTGQLAWWICFTWEDFLFILLSKQ